MSLSFLNIIIKKKSYSKPTKRNYKVIYDPELDFNTPKRSDTIALEYEKIIPGRAKDPRLSQNIKSRLYNTSFNIVSYTVRNK